jgi:hypothetical protein
MQKSTEEKTIQTIAAVASLVGLSLKKATTGDDLKEFTLTLAFTGVSAGLVQERFDFEREDTRLVAKVDGTNGHVDSIDGLQPGDTAETEAEANAEIAAAAGSATVGSNTTGPVVDTTPIDQTDAKPDIHLVGEAAALGKKRR